MQGLDSCSTQAECSNTIGSYECECVVGYQGDGISCTGIIAPHTHLSSCSEIVSRLVFQILMSVLLVKITAHQTLNASTLLVAFSATAEQALKT